MDTVGIVGLGVMGSNCAKKLMESGVPVAGYDPYPPAVKRASEAGVAVCGSPAELAGKARVILMFVPGPADTEKVVLGEGGIASGAPEGTVVVNMSTVDPGVNIRMGEALAPKGIDFVDAPVMGSPSGVGSWAFALGGSDEALAKIKDVLLVLSGSEEKLFHIGPLGHGNKLKLLNNMMLGAIDACAPRPWRSPHMGLSRKRSSTWRSPPTPACSAAPIRKSVPASPRAVTTSPRLPWICSSRTTGCASIWPGIRRAAHSGRGGGLCAPDGFGAGYGAKDHAVSWKAVAKTGRRRAWAVSQGGYAAKRGLSVFSG
ncbi:MAG: NAD(P)-dependent oxidoreductase [Bilophila wadsworthia]